MSGESIGQRRNITTVPPGNSDAVPPSNAQHRLPCFIFFYFFGFPVLN